jgi:hypothetical protein
MAEKAAAAPNDTVHNSVNFASVQDSRENLMSAAAYGIAAPMPPKFQFQDRRERLNWRQISDVDLNKITSEVDLKAYEGLLQNITYARIDRDDVDRFTDDFVRLFRLSQMSIEYLIYTQNYLECLTKALDVQYKTAYDRTKNVQEEIRLKNTLIGNLKRENAIKQRTLQTYKYLMEVPKEGDLSKAMTCPHCGRVFASAQFLRKHYERRHPDQDFDRDFPPEGAAVQKNV